MGEIADALKKANAERERDREATVQPSHHHDADATAESVARGWADPSAPAPAPRHAPAPAPPPAPAPSRTPSPAPPPSPTRADHASPAHAPAHAHAHAPAPAHAHAPAPAPAPEPTELPAIELDGQEPHVDHARHLALRIKSEMERRGSRSVMVASALRDEGKTTVSCNLAIALASVSSGGGVALIDLDLRNPSIGKRLGLHSEVGIDDVILGEIPLAHACHPLGGPRIDIYPTARPRPDAHEILSSPGFQATIDELHRRYELVVIDSPPTLLVPDSTLILRHVDCCVTVAHAGITRVRMYKKMLSTLPNERILGKILNAASAEKHQREYYAYGYGVDEPNEPDQKSKRGFLRKKREGNNK